MADSRGTVEGIHHAHSVKLYALSTCIWCRKTRQYLEDEKVAFDFVYVDLVESEERDVVKEEVRKWNPRISFPTVVIDDAACVVGFKTEELKAALGL
jgi:glutaredoxin